MMNKKELTTLVCAINQSVEWIIQRLWINTFSKMQ